MTRSNAEEHTLVRLSDTGFRLEDPWQDIRGRDIYASDGDQIGTVEDLYVNTEERERLGAKGANMVVPIPSASGARLPDEARAVAIRRR